MPTFYKWAPRILSLAFIAFLSLFALDAGTLQALAIHLIPSFALAIVLAFAWWWPWIGALFYAAAMLYVGRTLALHLSPAVKANWISVIAGPALVIALLFLVSWLQRRSPRLAQ